MMKEHKLLYFGEYFSYIFMINCSDPRCASMVGSGSRGLLFIKPALPVTLWSQLKFQQLTLSY